MDVSFKDYRHYDFKLQNSVDEKRKKRKEEIENKVKSSIERYDNVRETFSADKILDNYGRASLNIDFNSRDKEIPNGYSRYEYNGARFDIYRKEDEYKSQFVHPYDFDISDFERHFPQLEPVRNSINTNQKNSISDINGLIDENTIQGATGDCWIISALYSLSLSEKGKEIIKNSIKVNDDNTVTVTFAGIGVSYTLTENEISRHDTDNFTEDEYSNGDNDVLITELAVEKLWRDIEKGKISLNTDSETLLYTGEGMGISTGGLPSQLVYYLTGIESEEYYIDTENDDNVVDLSKEDVYKVLEDAYKSGNKALTIGVYFNNHTSKLTDGTVFELDLGNGGHALAVTDIKEDTVTFVNPWDTSIKYEMKWEEFAKLGIGYICSSNLDNVSLTSEIKDMTDKNSYSDYSIYDYDYIPNDYSIYNPYGFDNYNKDNNWEYNNSKYDEYNDYSASSISSIISEILDYISEILNMIKKYI